MKYVLPMMFLVLLSLVWSSVLGGDLEPSTTSKYLEAQREFMELKRKWEQEKENFWFSSRTTDYWKGPAGQNIIGMGKRALPFVMEEISRGDFLFNVPAQKITNISAPSGIERESEQKLSLDWIEWWKENKDNPEWNIYINNKVNANPHR